VKRKGVKIGKKKQGKEFWPESSEIFACYALHFPSHFRFEYPALQRAVTLRQKRLLYESYHQYLSLASGKLSLSKMTVCFGEEVDFSFLREESVSEPERV